MASTPGLLESIALFQHQRISPPFPDVDEPAALLVANGQEAAQAHHHQRRRGNGDQWRQQRRAPKVPALPAFREGKAPHNWIALHYLHRGTPAGIAGAPYEIHFSDGTPLDGKLAARRKALHGNINDLPVEEVLYEPHPAGEERPAAAS
jgi:hypothetical protein